MLTTDHEFIHKRLLEILACGAEDVDGLLFGAKGGRLYLEGTTEALNGAVGRLAGEEYEVSVPQLASLFSCKGGRLFRKGWERVAIRAIRGARQYRFFAPISVVVQSL